MRLIGQLKNEATARTFSDYLTSREIRNQIEPDPSGAWAVWVHAEDQLEPARQALAYYLENPGDPKFQRAHEAAALLNQKRQEEESSYAKRVRTPEMLWPRSGMGPLTIVLIATSVIVTLMLGFNLSPHLMISMSPPSDDLPEVRHGEIWRLITPIFMHMGIAHLIFNLFWLKDLGSAIEIRQGTPRFAGLVLVIAIGSNLCQYILDGPLFGGMSGVIYGLFGYIWMRGKSDPGAGLFMPPSTVVIMIVWFFLCLFQLIPHVANAAHGGGLVIGMILGALPWARKMFSR